MVDIKQVVKDPEFLSLPTSEKKKVFIALDPEFSKLSNEDQDKVVGSFGDANQSAYERGPSVFDTTREKAQRQASNFYTPMLIGAGSTLGSIAAAPADVATFNLIPSVIGGALGGAAGKRLAKQLDIATGYRAADDDLSSAMLETAADIAIGVPEEMLGLAIPALGVKAFYKDGVKRFNFKIMPKARAEAALSEKISGSFEPGPLHAPTAWGPIYAKNLQEAKEIEEATGMKFSLGQRTNSPSTVMLERSTTRTATGGADLYKEMEAYNNNKLHEYFSKNFGGDENIDNLLRAATDYKAGLAQDVSAAQKSVEARLLKIADENPDAFGPILENIRQNKAAYKTMSGELFDKVPVETQVPIDPLKKSLQELIDGYDPALEKSTMFPSKLVAGIQSKLSPTPRGKIEIPDEGISRPC